MYFPKGNDMFRSFPIPDSAFKYGPVALAFVTGIALNSKLQLFKPSPLPITDSTIEKLLEEGNQLYSSGKHQEASAVFKKALTSDNSITLTLMRLGNTAFAQNEFAQAKAYYQAARTINPNFVGVYMGLGLAGIRLKEYAQAIEYFSLVLKVQPENYEAHFQMSKAYMEQGQFDLAFTHAQRALELEPHNIHVYLNMGHIHNKNGTLEKALEYYRKALAMNPNFANAHYNLGYTLRTMGNPKEALKHLHKAEELQENYTDAYIAIAQAYWQLDDLPTAWKYYRHRWKLLGIDPEKMDIPLWTGQELRGKTILLYSEQGLGDTLQFIRFVKLVKQRGATIIVKVQKPLLSLLAHYPYIDKLIATADPSLKFDYQAPLLNLPGVLGTTANTIPAEIPYLKADPQLVAYWQKKLAHDTKFKIGLCWHVDPTHEADKSPWSKRSVEATMFTPLAQIPNVSFYSLQKVNGEDQLKKLPEFFEVKTFGYNFDESHGRFMDTAAVIHNLDLIITVDTSIAHVAAAMGKKVWMLLPLSPDPRWYDHRTDTPWYPTMKLFRQPKPYDWESPIKAMAAALKQQLRTRS